MQLDKQRWEIVLFMVLPIGTELQKIQTLYGQVITTWRTEDATVNACFDADRLDLGRVGITPDPDKMATAQGRIMAEKMMESNPEEDWIMNGG